MFETGKDKPSKPAKPQDPNYTMVLWKNVREVYKCLVCGANRDEEDDMITHVLKHVPANEREKLLDKLLKEKEQ